MLTAETILSLILTVGPAPGRTPYSVVSVAEGSPAPCDEPGDLMCRKPWYSPKRQAWVRYESEDEAIERRWTVARALDSIDASDNLKRAVLTVIQHESGYWLSVHAGENHWPTVSRPTKYEDASKSWCLGQVMLGFRHPDGPPLVGTDYASTRRCLARVVSHLTSALKQCARARTFSGRCVFAAYGGGQHLSQHPGILAREATMQRYLNAEPPPLSQQVRELLGIDTMIPKCRLS